MRISDWSSDVCSSDLEERGVLVLVGVARRTLDPWVRGPHQALLVLHQLQDVFLRADMIDFAQLRIILDEGLPLLAVERPIDRLGKEADPVPAEMDVGLDRKSVV